MGKYLFWGGLIGFLIGTEPLLPLFIGDLFIGDLGGVIFLTISWSPFNFVALIFQPFLKLEEFGTLLYFGIAPIFYALAGLLTGYIIYKVRTRKEN